MVSSSLESEEGKMIKDDRDSGHTFAAFPWQDDREKPVKDVFSKFWKKKKARYDCGNMSWPALVLKLCNSPC